MLSAYLELAGRQEAYSTKCIVMQSEGNNENNCKDGVWHGGLDDHDDDGIIDVSIPMGYGLHHLSHAKQTMCYEDSIKHSKPRLDAEVHKFGVDIIKCSTGACLNLDKDGKCYYHVTDHCHK